MGFSALYIGRGLISNACGTISSIRSASNGVKRVPRRFRTIDSSKRFVLHFRLMAKRKRKDPAAVALGKKGGKKRVKNQTPQERSESARHAITTRWARRQTDDIVRGGTAPAAKRKPEVSL
jgi:hypothetical protein